MNSSNASFPRWKAVTVAAGAVMLVGLLPGCATLSTLQDQLKGSASKPETAPDTVVAKPAKVEPPPDPEPPKKTKLYEWTGEGRSVTRIVVDTNEQKARFYEGDKEVGWTMVASGVSKYPTPVGTFSVQEKVANKESNLYGKIYGQGGKLISSNAKVGKTPIPPGARFDGADMPYFLRLTGDGIGMHAGPIPKPGRPASHGCIRMPKGFAPIAFRHVGVGTQVSVVGKGPSYSTYLAQQRASAPRPKPATPAPARSPSETPEAAVAQSTALQTVAQAFTPPAQPAVPPADAAVPQAESVATAAPDAPKVPAVARDPVPPVAPAIATRTEPPEGQGAAAPSAAQVVPQGQAPGQVLPPSVPSGVAPAPVVVPTPNAARAEAPAAPVTTSTPGPTAPVATTPAAPGTVYYPAPRVPVYRATAQAPVLMPHPSAPVAVQQPIPQGQPPAAAPPRASSQPAASDSKSPEQPSAAVQPAVPAQPASQPAQGAG